MARLSDKLAQHAQKPAAIPGLDLTTRRDVLTELRLEQVQPDPAQPRKDLGDLTELAASIRELGVVQPIIVSVAGMDRYLILAGERRFSASKLAGREKIPAIVRTVEEHERLQLQIIENLHRKDLTPFEEAQAYQALAEQFSLTQEAIAKRLGRSQESVSETLRLLSLPSEVRNSFDEVNQESKGRITKSLLLEIVRRPEAEQSALWERARRGDLTVKKIREVRKSAVGKGISTTRAMTFRYPIHLEKVTVTVHFEDRAKADIMDVIEALQAALNAEKERI